MSPCSSSAQRNVWSSSPPSNKQAKYSPDGDWLSSVLAFGVTFPGLPQFRRCFQAIIKLYCNLSRQIKFGMFYRMSTRTTTYVRYFYYYQDGQYEVVVKKKSSSVPLCTAFLFFSLLMLCFSLLNCFSYLLKPRIDNPGSNKNNVYTMSIQPSKCAVF